MASFTAAASAPLPTSSGSFSRTVSFAGGVSAPAPTTTGRLTRVRSRILSRADWQYIRQWAQRDGKLTQEAAFYVAQEHAAVTALQPAATTVAGLKAAKASGAGARAFVTDATTTTFGAAVAGGGSNAVPVYSDGTRWRIG